ncbi:MAG: hypothetical protein IPP82_04810 [Xanthomonadales bacterium]|nr:hypothetical protein [Xanthomonadales bacterium]
MTVFLDVFTGLGARHFEPWVRFGSTFSRPRFDASRSFADKQLRKEPEERIGIGAKVNALTLPLDP